jgi:hypothetical protein
LLSRVFTAFVLFVFLLTVNERRTLPSTLMYIVVPRCPIPDTLIVLETRQVDQCSSVLRRMHAGNKRVIDQSPSSVDFWARTTMYLSGQRRGGTMMYLHPNTDARIYPYFYFFLIRPYGQCRSYVDLDLTLPVPYHSRQVESICELVGST